jgi:L-alanine-DL-glutamate epimerase-like enolase superfamily enzyme
MTTDDTTIRDLVATTYRVPTLEPEADGTATWEATEVLVVEPVAGDWRGLGYSYCAAPAAAAVVHGLLRNVVVGADCRDLPGIWAAMTRAVRNAGGPGLVSMAIAAVDQALWDLKAKVLGLPLHRLLGSCRDSVPIYGSGGFVSMSDDQLVAQLHHWTDDLGATMVKIKVGEEWGTNPLRDLARTQLARDTVGPDVEVFVDANGGYTPGQARRLGRAYDDLGVTWFEEPVSSESLDDLALLRSSLRADVAAGEYLSSARAAEAMCRARAVDCLQLDVTRCAGITEWLRAAAVAQAYGLQVSGHCAPSAHLAPAAAIANLRHIEFFSDHERVEHLLFDGVISPAGGACHVDDTAMGNGLRLKPEAADHRS